eukprot:CAMPEP_0170426598 /NCGR_PEP_ID=MMETSP0117_2-20130122/38750_1 /TAXON_ID=400756 /ORGANISM="Durinskia baltica, Strain CSIRO CS-38" /LENGTH=201 /DNA_ID=CAMNT_0010685691 /DNA_START=112 /DNA_END=714 /DNA_ORIENTATION=+
MMWAAQCMPVVKEGLVLLPTGQARAGGGVCTGAAVHDAVAGIVRASAAIAPPIERDGAVVSADPHDVEQLTAHKRNVSVLAPLLVAFGRACGRRLRVELGTRDHVDNLDVFAKVLRAVVLHGAIHVRSAGLMQVLHDQLDHPGALRILSVPEIPGVAVVPAMPVEQTLHAAVLFAEASEGVAQAAEERHRRAHRQLGSVGS